MVRDNFRRNKIYTYTYYYIKCVFVNQIITIRFDVIENKTLVREHSIFIFLINPNEHESTCIM